MSMSELSIVIVSYNTSQYLERCLHAVEGSGHEIVVVDNASADGSVELVASRFPEVRLLALSVNIGFGAGANHGIDASLSRYILLLNPDAWPRDSDAIAALLACAERVPRAGVLGPTLIGIDGTPQVAVVGLPTRWWTGTPALSSMAPGRLGRAFLHIRVRREVSLVGAALLFRREALDEVGGFDPDFFLFGEEVDLCLRMQRAGWRVEHCRDSVFVHVGGAATRRDWPTMYREQVRGHLRLLAKHEGLDAADSARRYLSRVLRLRAAVASGEVRDAYRETASWLRSTPAPDLLAPSDRTPPGRS
jgi:GT2 family glycosyltransferase